MTPIRLVLVAVTVAVAVGAGVFWWRDRDHTPQFVTVAARRGDVVRAIVATGTVNPVVTVQVGTYVSGRIRSIACDYNTRVHAGQVCAKIDPRPFQVGVDQAEANLASAKAQLQKDRASLAYAKITYDRNVDLHKRGLVSQDVVDSNKSAYDQALAQIKVDEAAILQRQAALEAAQVNLDYTDIVSPVDGVVVSRDVDVGQTVAASFQTPTLFLIAQDLTKMQVDTNVSETDIGGVRVGEKANFTVEAFPGTVFHAVVSQVRQAPITVQNVVTYDVVLSVDNPEALLLPGMTANAQIVAEERRDVLEAPLQALRFDPQARLPAGGPAKRPVTPHVWVLRATQPVRIDVTTGIDDGNWVEISGEGLKPGDPVIVDERSESSRRGGQARPQRSPFRL